MKQLFSTPKKYKDIFQKNKIWFILASIGLLLMLLATGKTDAKQNNQVQQDFCETYSKNLEQKLEKVVCEVAGVKTCNIMITLKTGVEYVYATDATANTDVDAQEGDKKEQSEEKITIVTDKQIGEKAVVITERYPQVNGVSIICQAKDTPSLTLAIKNAASTALGIDPGKVCVILKG